MAHQTGYCETAISGCLAAAGLNPVDVSAAFSPGHLVDALNEAFSHENIVLWWAALRERMKTTWRRCFPRRFPQASLPRYKNRGAGRHGARLFP